MMKRLNQNRMFCKWLPIFAMACLLFNFDLKAQAPVKNSSEMFQRVFTALEQSQKDNVSTLAPTQFKKAKTIYEQAVAAYNDQKPTSEILELLNRAEAAYARAAASAKVSKIVLADGLTAHLQVRRLDFVKEIAPKSYERSEKAFKKAVALAEEGKFAEAEKNKNKALASLRAATIQAIETGLLKDIQDNLAQSRKRLSPADYKIVETRYKVIKAAVEVAKKNTFDITVLYRQTLNNVEEIVNVAQFFHEILNPHLLVNIDDDPFPPLPPLDPRPPLPPPPPPPWFLGWEANQGLPEYELIAGKTTLVRAFVRASPPVIQASGITSTAKATSYALPLFDKIELFPIGTLKLDYASLQILGPHGLNIEIPGEMLDGIFTNTEKSYSEDDNVNFYIDGSQLPYVGLYTFKAKFYRNGQLVQVLTLGTRRFHATKDMRLLIVVDTWPMSVSAWNTLTNALQYISRNFPIRSGIGPLDGDSSLGLRFIIEPVPFDPGFPGWGPVRGRFNAFNTAQAAAGKPDRVEHILTVRTQQSFESPLGGVGEAGPGGIVSGVTLNVNPPADNVFATLISQEIGHNFLGSAHTSESGFDNPSAFNLVDGKAITDPRSIMFGTYTGQKNEKAFFLPADWSKIRQGLLTKNSTGPN